MVQRPTASAWDCIGNRVRLPLSLPVSFSRQHLEWDPASGVPLRIDGSCVWVIFITDGMGPVFSHLGQ